MEFRTVTFNGRRICYSPGHTKFLIQVGKGPKGAYSTRYTITGSMSRALMMYEGINIGNGYKKRLYVPSFNKPVLARAYS